MDLCSNDHIYWFNDPLLPLHKNLKAEKEKEQDTILIPFISLLINIVILFLKP